MTVNHDPAQIAPAGQKRFPDPKQIIGNLLIQLVGGIDPRVHEQVVPALETQLQALQKLDMLARYPLAQTALHPLVIALIVLGTVEPHAVAEHRGITAVA
jgi:hypothetical protein